MTLRPFIFLLPLLLASCGFKALHGQDYRDSLTVDLSTLDIQVDAAETVTSSTLNSSTTSTVPRRYGELLKAEIQDRVNPVHDVSEKLFTLEIHYQENDIALFVRPDGTASRGNMLYASTYTIKRIADQKLVASGTVNTTSSYNTSPTADYASYVSIEDARKRAVLDLAENYKLRLAALLPTLNNPNGTTIEPAHEPYPTRPQIHDNEVITPGY